MQEIFKKITALTILNSDNKWKFWTVTNDSGLNKLLLVEFSFNWTGKATLASLLTGFPQDDVSRVPLSVFKIPQHSIDANFII